MRALFASILILFSLPLLAQGFLKVQGPAIVNEKGEAVILRGMGLGGWMLQEPYMLQLSGSARAQYDIRQKITELIGKEQTATFYAAWLANHCRKADIDSLAAWGFNSVRLPLHYNLFTPPLEEEPDAQRDTWLETGFALTDSLLSWCAANKMYLILDLHAAPGAQGNDVAISDHDTTKPSLWKDPRNQRKTIALWTKLAERYRDEPWIGAYDLINEPNYGFQDPADKNGCAETANNPLKNLLNDITAAIRAVDQRHIIIVEGNCWGNNYQGMLPFSDPNTVLSFHKYWNYNDTASIQRFLDMRSQYNMPIWLGESGENSNAWFRDAIQLMEDHQIGWAWWPLKKLGFNNPFEVKVNAGYQKVLHYWKGTGPKPSKEEAFEALMQLTEDLKTENNMVHRDVVDAMVRQVRSTETLPFKPHVLQKSVSVLAVDYDLGRSGYAYHDRDSGTYWVSSGVRTDWNKGRVYRNDGVDIERCADGTGEGYCVASTEAGEWLQYTLEVPKAGRYQVQLHAAAQDSAGSVRLTLNDRVVASNVAVAKTGSGEKWQTARAGTFRFQKGRNRVRVYVLKGGFRLHSLEFKLSH